MPLQRGIVVRGEHLGVRVHVDARALGLLKQHLEVAQVVARDEDAGVRARLDADLRHLRAAVRAGVRGVQERHAVHAVPAELEGERDEIVHAQRFVQGLRQGLLHERVHGLVVPQQGVRVRRVRGEALHAVRDELAQAAHVLVFARQHADRRRLRREVGVRAMHSRMAASSKFALVMVQNMFVATRPFTPRETGSPFARSALVTADRPLVT